MQYSQTKSDLTIFISIFCIYTHIILISRQKKKKRKRKNRLINQLISPHQYKQLSILHSIIYSYASTYALTTIPLDNLLRCCAITPCMSWTRIFWIGASTSTPHSKRCKRKPSIWKGMNTSLVVGFGAYTMIRFTILFHLSYAGQRQITSPELLNILLIHFLKTLSENVPIIWKGRRWP